jgi:hypothetical protein
MQPMRRRSHGVEGPPFFILLGHALIGTGTIALDPTFGSFTLLKLVS